MIFFKCLFLLALWNVLDHAIGLIRVPHIGDNEILKTEAVLRSTTNKLFSSLLLKTKNRTQLKHYSLIHNYFTSLTLKHHYNLKKIAGLTRVSHENVDSKTLNYTVLINEILNEDSETNEFKENRSKVEGNDHDLTYHIDHYLEQLKNLKEFYTLQSNHIDKIREILNRSIFNASETFNNGDSKDDEFWDPSDLFSDSRRIYQGRRSRIKKFPFMAVVQVMGTFHCAGSIIASDLVITAASCLQLAWNNRFFREKPAFLAVRVGCDFYASDGEEISVLEVYFHPSYNPKTLNSNLAIMRLSRDLNFKKSRKRVMKIRIDKHDNPLPVNTERITVVGWGAMTTSNVIGDPWRNKIHYANLEFYPLLDCQEIYTKEFVSDTNFCAGFVHKGIGACNRDLGGPGIVEGKLAGVISFGSPQCGTPDSPTVFTKVGYYTDWIETIMEQPVIKLQARTTTTIHPLLTVTTNKMDVWTANIKSTKLEDATDKSNPDPNDPWVVEDNGFATTTSSYLRDEGNPKLYKDFLKTMFDSSEIDRYVEILLEEQEGTKKQSGQDKVSNKKSALPKKVVDLTTKKDILFLNIDTHAMTEKTKKNKNLLAKNQMLTTTETNIDIGVDGSSTENVAVKTTPLSLQYNDHMAKGDTEEDEVPKKKKDIVKPNQKHTEKDTFDYGNDDLSSDSSAAKQKKTTPSKAPYENIMKDDIEKDNIAVDKNEKELQDQLEDLLQYVNNEGDNIKDKTVGEDTLNLISNLDTDVLSLLLEPEDMKNLNDNSMAGDKPAPKENVDIPTENKKKIEVSINGKKYEDLTRNGNFINEKQINKAGGMSNENLIIDILSELLVTQDNEYDNNPAR